MIGCAMLRNCKRIRRQPIIALLQLRLVSTMSTLAHSIGVQGVYRHLWHGAEKSGLISEVCARVTITIQAAVTEERGASHRHISVAEKHFAADDSGPPLPVGSMTSALLIGWSKPWAVGP